MPMTAKRFASDGQQDSPAAATAPDARGAARDEKRLSRAK
jgi:hypothetical protein